MSDFLITGPGKYPTMQGVTTIEALDVDHGDYAIGYRWHDKGEGRTYMPDGRFDQHGAITGNTDGDITGPRIPEPDVQDGIVGVEQPRRAGDRECPLTAFERFGEWSGRRRDGGMEITRHGPGEVQCQLTRQNDEGFVFLQINTFGTTPEDALGAAMDIVEDVA